MTLVENDYEALSGHPDTTDKTWNPADNSKTTNGTARNAPKRHSHVKILEEEAIFVMREVAAQ
ncbi:hypothetical protein QLX67_03880, partial [Balneolaceae bacterium ANBcel3]|nr:hypothetical protein [Balneolaceae bacterium ANBcel3]